MFCENCGNSLPDNAKFCNICGVTIENEVIEEELVEEQTEEQLEEVTLEEEKVVVEAEATEKPVKVKEAIKFVSFVGIAVAVAGTFLDSVSYKLFDNQVTEKMFDYRVSDVFLAGLAIMFIMLIIRQSKLAVAGLSVSLCAIYLYVWEFIQYRKDYVENIKLGLGTYLIGAGILLAVIGLFIKFSKKNKLFK